MSYIYGIQPLKLYEICCQSKKIWNTLYAGTLAIQLI